MGKKIIFFIPRMTNGGAERVVALLANELSAQFSIEIFTITDNESFYELNDNVKISGANITVSKKKVIRTIRNALNSIKLYYIFQKQMHLKEPDIVISFLTECNIISLLQQKRSYKLIVSERNDPRKYNVIYKYLLKRLYPTSDLLVCQTQIIKNVLKCSNSIVIPNPIAVRDLPEPYFGITKKEIVAVGRLTAQKNFALLIDSFKLISEVHSEYKLRIFGEGELRQQLQNQINQLKLYDRVVLEGVKHNVMEEYREATLFVMSSDYEGFPNALVEAMAVGLPVVCTDVPSGAARELIKEQNGIVVPTGDKLALANAMDEILNNEKLQVQMKRKNLEVRKIYSVEQIASMWIKTMEL